MILATVNEVFICPDCRIRTTITNEPIMMSEEESPFKKPEKGPEEANSEKEDKVVQKGRYRKKQNM